MASTGFWPVKSRLKDVISYAENPDKTIDKKYLDEDLRNAIEYAANSKKTDETMYVSAINCPKQRAYECMMATKKRFGKMGGNVAYHGYQSFVSGEVTPEEAHKIGVKTARLMWGAEYEIVVTTHLNTDNIHNHFVVNSVSFKTGRKFENHIRDHIELRNISDSVCLKYDKSVIPFDHFYGNKKAYWAKQSGAISHRDMLRKDLDEALKSSNSVKELEFYLFALGYKLNRSMNFEHPSVIAVGWSRAIRLDSLGDGYSRENILERIESNPRTPYGQAPNIPSYYRKPLDNLQRQMRIYSRMDSVQLLFALFTELIKACTGNNIEEQRHTIPKSPVVRAEVAKLDKTLEEYWLLQNNNINSFDELKSFQNDISKQIADLENERYKGYLLVRRAKTPEEAERLKAACRVISEKIKPLRKQRAAAIRIEQRIPEIQRLLAIEQDTERGRYPNRDKKERGYER